MFSGKMVEKKTLEIESETEQNKPNTSNLELCCRLLKRHPSFFFFF